MKENQFQEMDRRTFLKGMSMGAAATFAAPAVLSAQSETKTTKKDTAEKIDIFPHILPHKFKEALFKKANRSSYYVEAGARRTALFDLDVRFKDMDRYGGLRQVLNLGVPPMEYVLSPKDAVDLARMANDEMAELLNKYPDRFVAAVAGLPLNDVDASIRELERAVKDLKFKGIQIFSSINGKPLDRPEFIGLYEKMAQYDLPILIHPAKDQDIGDYPGESSSKYGMFQSFGWPYETTLAMGRLVYSGIMEKYPNLKIITHHCGGMLPFFSTRGSNPTQPGEVMKLTKAPVEYFRKFYADTVLAGNTVALTCGLGFFGPDHIVFGTDYPYPGGANQGAAIGEVIKSVDQLKVSEEEKVKIFSKNARRLLNLS